MRRLACWCVTLVLLTGCSRSSDQSSSSAPAPRIADLSGTSADELPPSAGADPPLTAEAALPAAAADGGEYTVVPVFYGTNRRPTGVSAANEFYGSGRSELQLGLCEVSIPKGHETGELERPRIWKFEFRENPERHVVLLSVEPVDGTEFLGRLRATVAAAEASEAFVFIHGYNVTFKDAARRTAQIAHDLNFRGAPILFSWPARGELADYTVDESTARWAERDAAEFIEAVARASGAKRIHLIAHSMGNRVLAGALDRLAQSARRADFPLFNQVVLTAPDLDAGVFKRDLAPRLVQTADCVTIYASADDRALLASQLLHGVPRLGQAGARLTLFPEFSTIDVIDASGIDTSLFGHSYFGSSESVLGDLRQVFLGRRAAERRLAAGRSGAFWTLLRRAGLSQSAERGPVHR